MLHQALAPATQSNYARSLRKYNEFAVEIGINSSFPISVKHACLFLVFLFNNKFSPTSILTIMSGLTYCHKIRLLTDPFQFFPVRQLFQAIKKNSPSPGDSRLPISESILFDLLDNIHLLGLSKYESILLSTMFLFAFYFGLRIGEYTASPHNLQLTDVCVSHKEVVIIFQSFKHSKQRSLPHSIKPSSLRHCLVKSAMSYASLRPPIEGAFFVYAGKPVSPKSFTTKLKQIISLIGKSPEKFSPHSFRIGAATHWFNKQFSEYQIRQLGRWSSNAFTSYIRNFIDHSA